MEVQFHRHGFPLPSSSSLYPTHSSFQSEARVVPYGFLMNCSRGRNKGLMRLAFLENGSTRFRYQLVGFRKQNVNYSQKRRFGRLLPCGSTDDSVTVNGIPTTSSSGDVDEIRMALNQSIGGEDQGDNLVQFLHDEARAFELAIKKRGLVSKFSWFSTAWLGVGSYALLKTLSYQASVYSLLQAACEVASRRTCGDKDTNIFVQRCLLRLSAHLEGLIREKLSTKQLGGGEWFWSEQTPSVVKSFVNYFEVDPRFSVSTAMPGNGKYMGSNSGTNLSLLLLALTCIAAITKLGPSKVSCPQLFPVDITGNLMDMLVNLIPLHQAYRSIKDIGLGREFLVHFGPRAAACRVSDDLGSKEVVFWVNLVQKQLQRAIYREKIWSRLTTSESIEVLNKDLAIFGFFIALGRSTRSFLSVNGFDVVNEPIESFIRNLSDNCSNFSTERIGSITYLPTNQETDSFDKALEGVEEAVIRLENLLQEYHVSNSARGKEQLKAACSDLEKIRKLKKEAEFLRASIKAKSESLEQQPSFEGGIRTNGLTNIETGDRKLQGLWSFIGFLFKKPDSDLAVSNESQNEKIGRITSGTGAAKSESINIQRFKLIRNELTELEKRVQRSTFQYENEEEIKAADVGAQNSVAIQVKKNEDIVATSLEKLKKTSMNVLQGTQLLAIDVGAAMGLLRRTLIRDELTEKEKRNLKRTVTDVASVVPIAILMLLPVTAVGHAAILAAIQRYVPGLIPSTYGPERLYLLRQLEKVKQMNAIEADPKENIETSA
ncbi:hypothetical protein LINPERHAP2_LOCUS12705 [Linum perenne]